MKLLSLVAFATLLVAAPVALGDEHGAPADEHGASAGHGEGGGHHAGIDPKTLGIQLFNFAVVVLILVKFAGKALNKALAARHEQLKKDLKEAAEARAAAEVLLKEQERRLANLEQEVGKLRASIKDEAEKEQARLVAAAEEKARRIHEEARFLMNQQVKEAELRLREEVAGAAVKIAEELVKRSVLPDDETRLASGFVADLERGSREART